MPCAEGLKRTAPIDEMNEVRCCRDCTGLTCGNTWSFSFRGCPTFDPDLSSARSKAKAKVEMEMEFVR